MECHTASILDRTSVTGFVVQKALLIWKFWRKEYLNTHVFHGVLQRNRFLIERKWIVLLYDRHCWLLKVKIEAYISNNT